MIELYHRVHLQCEKENVTALKIESIICNFIFLLLAFLSNYFPMLCLYENLIYKYHFHTNNTFYISMLYITLS